MTANASLPPNLGVGSRDPPPLPFKSRRSPFVCMNGCVSTSQPLASSIGLDILRQGGNAADAALAVAAALSVLEPCSTGLGGDMFALYYDAETRKVSSINGSGRCPGNLTIDLLREKYPLSNNNNNNNENKEDPTEVDSNQFKQSVDSITVPGAARGWEDFYHKWCSKDKFSFMQLLEPAAKLADDGFPVSPMTAYHWSTGLESDVKKWLSADDILEGNIPLSINGQGPRPGDVMVNHQMANVLRSLGTYGATQGFYQGFPGRDIVDVIQRHGGVMTMDDMCESLTQSSFPEPIFVEYHDVKLWQVPPNGQGVAGLIALKGVEALEKNGIIEGPEASDDSSGWKSSQTWHAMIEMMRLGFADARAYVCDPDYKNQKKPVDIDLLSESRIVERAIRLYDDSKAVVEGMPHPSSCTVSFQVVDNQGNAVSFVNSNYMGFGTGLVPKECGFTLQNRGCGFNLDPDHPNALMPYKRPYHTIIPGMLTHSDTNELYATLSNMGGFMQPQGHMQLTISMVKGGLDPQTAVDIPRFCISDGTHNGTVFIEDGVDPTVITELLEKGHNLQYGVSGHHRSIFGKAQIIKRDRRTGVLWAGSDGRSDGCAMGF